MMRNSKNTIKSRLCEPFWFPNICPSTSIQRQLGYTNNPPSDFYSKSDATMFKLFSSLDNYLRQTLGLADHNEKWIKEFAMVKLFYKWFEGFKQITQASPEWLKPQRLDLLIPDLRFAIEYQGEQHFMPIEIFGGKEGFQTRQEADERKKKLCEANGISLEYINYDEDLLERVKDIYSKYFPYINAKKHSEL